VAAVIGEIASATHGSDADPAFSWPDAECARASGSCGFDAAPHCIWLNLCDYPAAEPIQ
jgi:hypothetical protein